MFGSGNIPKNGGVAFCLLLLAGLSRGAFCCRATAGRNYYEPVHP